MALRVFGIVLLALFAIGCPDEGKSGDEDTLDPGGDTISGDNDDPETWVADPSSMGGPCWTHSGCEAGLVCLLSEYAPFGWCAEECAEEDEGRPCLHEGDTQAHWLCVGFPTEDRHGFGFLGNYSRFCAPLCFELEDCLDEHGLPWETCEQPEWHGNPLYPSQPDKVCQAPSAWGERPVQPSDCDYSHVTIDFSDAITRCRLYCEYLSACQHWAPDEPLACCEWGCYLEMTATGRISLPYRDLVTCYVDWYNAFQGTTMVCDTPDNQDCDQPPPIPEYGY